MRILIGDDHMLFREGLRRLLEQLSADATFTDASTFNEVRKLVEEEEPFDLILIDLQMPGWPGFSGIEDLCQAAGDTPVVVISASESQSDVRAALDNGASGYIPKSSSVKIMLSALHLVLAGGIYLPPSVIGADTAAATGAGTTNSATEDEAPRNGSHLLTQRQWEVLNCLREGKSNKQIAYELGLSEGTVKIHVTAIFKTLGVKNRTQAVIVASELQR